MLKKIAACAASLALFGGSSAFCDGSFELSYLLNNDSVTEKTIEDVYSVSFDKELSQKFWNTKLGLGATSFDSEGSSFELSLSRNLMRRNKSMDLHLGIAAKLNNGDLFDALEVNNDADSLDGAVFADVTFKDYGRGPYFATLSAETSGAYTSFAGSLNLLTWWNYPSHTLDLGYRQTEFKSDVGTDPSVKGFSLAWAYHF